MFDVAEKFNTLRYARAEGYLYGRQETLRRVAEGRVPKGDLVEVTRAAGILAAKRCSDWIVFCHPIPIDWVEVALTVGEGSILVEAEVRSVWKTGVEMEAISAVTAALLNAYDMLKPLDDTLSITDIRVVEKKGGKADFQESFEEPISGAVLVISDSTFAGTREDTSGKLIKDFLKKYPIEFNLFEVMPDEEALIAERLQKLVDEEGIRLIITTGGTGLGPRDRTPEATMLVMDREVPGIAEAIRSHGRDRTPFAMHSRGIVGVRGKSLIVNLPGSSKGARESLEALFPGLLHVFPMMDGGGHEGK